MSRQRTTDNRQQTFLDTELVEVPKRTCAFDKLRHRSLPVAHCSLLIAIIFILCSCSTNKSTSNLRTLSANHIIREVEDNRFEFDNLDTKFNVRLEGNNIGLKGQLKMKNDSVIWISLSLKLGIEVARVMITEDSVKLINRTNKTYFVESVDKFQERLPSEVTMQFLQDILVGNDILLSKNDKSVNSSLFAFLSSLILSLTNLSLMVLFSFLGSSSGLFLTIYFFVYSLT